MSKKTKLILSVIGLGAVVVPAVLLLVLTARTKEVPDVPTEDRQINTKNIQDATDKLVPSRAPFASPATSSATPKPTESNKPSPTSQ